MSDAIREQIRSYLNDQFLFHASAADVPVDVSIFGRGMLDSAHMVDVITFLEKDFGIAIPSTDITPENFDTITRMAGYVQRAQAMRR